MNTLQDTLSTLTEPAQGLVRSVLAKAKEIFDANGKLDPVVFAIPPLKKEVKVMNIPVLDDQTKPVVWALMEEVRATHPVCAFISETWVVRANKNKPWNPNVMPSKSPDREEMALLSVWERDRVLLIFAKIARNPDVLGEWEVEYDSSFPGKDGRAELAGGMQGTKRYPDDKN